MILLGLIKSFFQNTSFERIIGFAFGLLLIFSVIVNWRGDLWNLDFQSNEATAVINDYEKPAVMAILASTKEHLIQQTKSALSDDSLTFERIDLNLELTSEQKVYVKEILIETNEDENEVMNALRSLFGEQPQITIMEVTEGGS